MATCWAGKTDWMIARKEQNSPEDKYKFITYILNNLKQNKEKQTTETKTNMKQK